MYLVQHHTNAQYWKRNGWRNIAGEPVANEDLWDKIFEKSNINSYPNASGSCNRFVPFALISMRCPRQVLYSMFISIPQKKTEFTTVQKPLCVMRRAGFANSGAGLPNRAGAART
jgi:hypothetical protein